MLAFDVRDCGDSNAPLPAPGNRKRFPPQLAECRAPSAMLPVHSALLPAGNSPRCICTGCHSQQGDGRCIMPLALECHAASLAECTESAMLPVPPLGKKERGLSAPFFSSPPRTPTTRTQTRESGSSLLPLSSRHLPFVLPLAEVNPLLKRIVVLPRPLHRAIH